MFDRDPVLYFLCLNLNGSSQILPMYLFVLLVSYPLPTPDSVSPIRSYLYVVLLQLTLCESQSQQSQSFWILSVPVVICRKCVFLVTSIYGSVTLLLKIRTKDCIGGLTNEVITLQIFGFVSLSSRRQVYETKGMSDDLTSPGYTLLLSSKVKYRSRFNTLT